MYKNTFCHTCETKKNRNIVMQIIPKECIRTPPATLVKLEKKHIRYIVMQIMQKEEKCKMEETKQMEKKKSDSKKRKENICYMFYKYLLLLFVCYWFCPEHLTML